MIDKDTFLRFCDEALVAMRDIVVELGDDLANRRPDLPGANSPFAILTHCLGVCAAWASTTTLGEVVPRDRPGEFPATGAVGSGNSANSYTSRNGPSSTNCQFAGGDRSASCPSATRTCAASGWVYPKATHTRGARSRYARMPSAGPSSARRIV